MAPVGSAIPLPPGGANGVGAHAQSHAELEKPCECTDRWHADHQALQNAYARISLHEAHELVHELDGHQAVGVEHERKLVLLAPTLAEIRYVAGLVAGILLTPPIRQRNPAAPCGRERCKAALLCCNDVAVAAVAQHVKMKFVARIRCRKTGNHRLEQMDNMLGRLVADAQE